MIEIRVINKSTGIQTHGGLVNSLEEADRFIEQNKQHWGSSEQVVQIEKSHAVYNEQGELLQEAILEEQIIPASYEIFIEDITAKVAQEQINAEALAFLAATDWMVIRELDCGVPCPAEIKAQRQAARERIVK